MLVTEHLLIYACGSDEVETMFGNKQKGGGGRFS